MVQFKLNYLTGLILVGLPMLVAAQNNTITIRNTYTKYLSPKPEGVCFEDSVDRYRIKKKHTVSALMNYFELRPLFCKDCSVETAQNINRLEDVDYVLPGQTLTIPKKCHNFTWVDKFDYSKVRAKRMNDEDASIVMNNRYNLSAHRKIASYAAESTDTLTSDQPESNEPLLNDNIENKIISEVQISKPKIQVAEGKVSIKPFLIFNNLKITSADLSGVLKSNAGTGLFFAYESNYKTQSSLGLEGSYYQSTLNNDNAVDVNIEGAKINPFQLEGFFKYRINYDWSLSAKGGVSQNIFALRSDLSTVQVETSLGTQVGIYPEYTIYHKNRFKVLTELGLNFMLPQSFGDKKIDMGFRSLGSLKTQYRLNSGQVESAIQISRRDQKNDTAAFIEQNYLFMIGYNHLF